MTATVAVALVALVAAVLAAGDVRNPELPPALSLASASVEAVPPARPVYRYSVVPGGVYSAGELRDAMSRDAVVAAHHGDVSVDSLDTVFTAGPRLVFMSYRRGDEIYWTRTRVLLPAGEAVLTDGVAEIRARCGNAISNQPMQPTADAEPLAGEFERVSDAQGEFADDAYRSPIVPPLGSSSLSHVPFMNDLVSAADAPDLGGLMPGWFGTGGAGGRGGGGSAPGGSDTFGAGGQPMFPNSFFIGGGDPDGDKNDETGGEPPWPPIDGGNPLDLPKDLDPPGGNGDPENPDLNPFIPDLPPGYDPETPGNDPNDPHGPNDPNDPNDPSVQAIPEPATLFLFAGGATAALLRLRRRQR